ncbi:hypothetical protein [Sphingomonas rubra]|uniref:Uncharacterized protein n=1 Tax=Sphingomonas rubra TaxID=634430 RepID=A0A1I5UU89_9SPHN|nr:hypothetical protein [Sphingomonas rubra]SFP98815.1 hypothetical protein SAMN04488241_11623 [Sphingomonas rubra]
MNGLFRATDGFFPVADIKSVQHVDARPGRAEHYVVRRHSSEAAIDLSTWDMVDLSRRPIQLVPVEPGTKLIVVYVDHEGAFADTLPLISWALCLDGFVRPVMPAGVRRGYSEHGRQAYCYHPDYVQMPDGGIYEYGYEAEPERLDTIEAVLAKEASRYEMFAAERQDHGGVANGETAQ